MQTGRQISTKTASQNISNKSTFIYRRLDGKLRACHLLNKTYDYSKLACLLNIQGSKKH